MSGIIVAGMHRSGTSLATQFLAAGGWDPGEVLLSSPKEEYYEDSSFVELHRRWLVELNGTNFGEADTHNHPDWGIVDGNLVETLATTKRRRAERHTQVANFIEGRRSQARMWVAKDPRATLFLDDWASDQELRFLVVYRNPWDMVDSAIRTGHGPFCQRPKTVRDAWLSYNQRVLNFARRYRDRVLLVSGEAMVTTPTSMWKVLDQFVRARGNLSHELVDPNRFVIRSHERAIAIVYRDLYPDHTKLLNELDAMADLPRSNPKVPGTRTRSLPGGSLPAGVGLQVVTACRDDGDFLAEAVASVDDIADGSVELTIVDDGSTDPETIRVLAELERTGRHVIKTEAIGLSAARNTGCSTSRTKAVIALDADNRLRPAVLMALAELNEKKLDVVHGSWHRFGIDDQIVNPPEMTLESLIPYNSIDACAVVSRDLLTRLGGWDEQLPFWEDWDMWLGTVQVGAQTKVVEDTHFDYLVRPDSLSRGVTADSERLRTVCQYVIAKHHALFRPELRKLIEWIHRADVMHLEHEKIHRQDHLDALQSLTPVPILEPRDKEGRIPPRSTPRQRADRSATRRRLWRWFR